MVPAFRLSITAPSASLHLQAFRQGAAPAIAARQSIGAWRGLDCSALGDALAMEGAVKHQPLVCLTTGNEIAFRCSGLACFDMREFSKSRGSRFVVLAEQSAVNLAADLRGKNRYDR